MQDRRGYVPVALGKYQDSRENGIDRGRCVWILGFSFLKSAYEVRTAFSKKCWKRRDQD